MFSVLDTATSGLVAQRTNLDVIAGNIAMRDVTRNERGEAIPYRRKVALFAANDPKRGERPGVRVSRIADDATPFGLRWDPGHADAIREGEHQGYVRTSNVDYQTEMVNAMVAARMYEANVTVAEMAKRMLGTTLALLA